jgi:type II secretory pathway component PulF
MDHKEQHHEHHRKERAEEKKHEHEVERREDKQVRTIHPLWFVVIGSVLILSVVGAWILMTSHFYAG